MVSILDRRDIFPTLVDYQRESGNPLGIPKEEMVSWSEGMTFERGSGTFIFTGSLYQMVPWMAAYSSQISRLEASGLPAGTLLRTARGLGSLGKGIVSAVTRVDRSLSSRCSAMVRRASQLVMEAGIPHGYMGKNEPYSGVIFMEMGLEDIFSEVANRAFSEFKAMGVKRLITLDPHSTVALREWYPRYVDGFDIRVEHYLEVVKFEGRSIARQVQNPGRPADFAVHDPCLLARKLDLDGKLREALDGAGVHYSEPARCRKGTFCCGGPVESIAPRLAGAIAAKRKEQLRDVADGAVVACPVCFANLGKEVGRTDVPVTDLLEVL